MASPAIDQALERIILAVQTGRPADAERMAADLLKQRPQFAPALHLLGYSRLMQGRPQDAIEPLEQAARTLRDGAVDTQLAMALRQADRTDEALERLDRAIKRKPPFPGAYYELGNLLFGLQRFDEAIDVLKQAVAALPQVPELWALLGTNLNALCLLRGHDPSEAKAAFERALSIAPGHPGASYGLGLLLMERRDFTHAADHLQRALAGNPGDPQARLNLAICLIELGQNDAAFEALRAATKAGPQMFGQAIKALTSSGKGRFWLKPSAAAKILKS